MAEYTEPVLIYDRIASNRRRTFALLIVFFLVVAAASTAVGYLAGLPIGLAPVVIVFVLVFAAFSYYGSDGVALAVANARATTEAEEPQLFRTVENLCIGAGLPR